MAPSSASALRVLLVFVLALTSPVSAFGNEAESDERAAAEEWSQTCLEGCEKNCKEECKPSHHPEYVKLPPDPWKGLDLNYRCPLVDEMDGEPYELQLHCPSLPDIPQPRLEGKNVILAPQPDWDLFSWNSFIAMSWPAREPTEANGYQRGFPNVSDAGLFDFTTATAADGTKLNDPPLTVWETFKEKREIFQYCPEGSKDCPATPGPWNNAPDYLGQMDEVAACDSSSGDAYRQQQGADRSTAGAFPRYFGQMIKGGHWNNLDETAEVLSEALEDPSALCGGWSTEPCCSASEIRLCGTDAAPSCCSSQPACCSVYGQGVAPRVWKGDPADGGGAVRYEVKVNYDFYRYVMQKRYYDDEIKNRDAKSPRGPYVKLPYRTNDYRAPRGSLGVAAKKSKGSPTLDPYFEVNDIGRVLGYSSAACLALSEEVDRLARNTGEQGDFFPCPAGSVHIKAAWVPLGPEDDPSRFHTTEATYFDNDAEGNLCAETGTFGLVGLHIIQRVHQKIPDALMAKAGTSGLSSEQLTQLVNARVVGGAFVFSTWEHVDVEKGGYFYTNYYPGRKDGTGPPAGFYPKKSHALPVERYAPLEPVILPSTKTVNERVREKIRGENPESVWQYYQLIGTQVMPINTSDAVAKGGFSPHPPHPNDPTGIGQPLYLANLVIETNIGLQHYKGLPPQTDVISYQNHCQTNGSRKTSQGIASYILDNPLGQYWREGALDQPCVCLDLPEYKVTECAILEPYNVVYGKYDGQYWSPTGFNMGGCMGCHGVSQLEGYSFSYVLQDGQRGAQPDTESDFVIVPTLEEVKMKTSRD